MPNEIPSATTASAPKTRGGVKRWLKRIVLAFLIILIIFMTIVVFQNPDFRITRSTTIAVPSGAVFAQINDFHNWRAWSPWAKLDPNCKYTYEGPPSGAGSSMSWAGNSDVGEGRMTILDSRPELLKIKLEFLKPFQGTSTAEFTLQAKPDASQTAVTWSMYGQHSFIEKAVCLFMNMDKMVGGDFEKGLAQMKTVAESASKN